MANGKSSEVWDQMIPKLNLQIQSYEEEIDFEITRLAHFDLALGKAWHAQKRPIIDFTRHVYQFDYGGQRHVIKGERQLPEGHLITAMQLRKQDRKHGTLQNLAKAGVVSLYILESTRAVVGGFLPAISPLRDIENVVAANMSSVGAKKGLLEVFKFGCYVSIPIFMMTVFANNSENLEKIIRNRSYVVYPPEGPRAPPPEEIREMIRKNRSASGSS